METSDSVPQVKVEVDTTEDSKPPKPEFKCDSTILKSYLNGEGKSPYRTASPQVEGFPADEKYCPSCPVNYPSVHPAMKGYFKPLCAVSPTYTYGSEPPQCPCTCCVYPQSLTPHIRHTNMVLQDYYERKPGYEEYVHEDFVDSVSRKSNITSPDRGDTAPVVDCSQKMYQATCDKVLYSPNSAHEPPLCEQEEPMNLSIKDESCGSVDKEEPAVPQLDLTMSQLKPEVKECYQNFEKYSNCYSDDGMTDITMEPTPPHHIEEGHLRDIAVEALLLLSARV